MCVAGDTNNKKILKEKDMSFDSHVSSRDVGKLNC